MKHAFQTILTFLKLGASARRESWPSGDRVEIAFNTFTGLQNEKTILIHRGQKSSSWFPYPDDLLAEDWEVVIG